MSQKYQNSSDLKAAMNQAVEQRKGMAKAVDPKERWKQGQAASRRKRSIAWSVLLLPLALASIAYFAYQMGFRIGKPAALSEALATPESATILRLEATHLKEYPAEIKALTSLKELYLDSNTISSLPQSIGELSHLQLLSVQYNQLTSLPEEIGKLAMLQDLVLQNNKLTSLPNSVTSLSSLQRLDVADNDLKELPPKIGLLRELRILRLHGSSIAVLPSSFSKLSKLEEVDLSGNPLTSLPEPDNYPNLRRLNLRNTGIPDATVAKYKARLPKVSIMK